MRRRSWVSFFSGGEGETLVHEIEDCVVLEVMILRSLGYGYVNFHSVSDAERALDTLNYSAIKVGDSAAAAPY